MSKIKIGCPECSSQYSVDDSHLGRRARCKKCNARFAVTRIEEIDHRQTESVGISEAQTSASASEDGVPAEWNKGDVILGQYEVRGILGEGGIGRVYDAGTEGGTHGWP